MIKSAYPIGAACSVLVCLSLFNPSLTFAANPSFPGATGPGAVATGGRGGDVYHVTNLNADLAGTVSGSFLYGVKNAPGAGRTIVFDVGGTIYYPGGSGNDDTIRFNWGNVTIAGQTAPGPGITIAGTGTKWTGTDVILRNIAVRPNKSSKPDTVTYDSFSLQMKSSIVDHVSATWFSDEGISSTDAGANTTVQYAVIADGLNYNGHAFGSIISTENATTEYSFNHNLYGQLTTRIPAVGSEMRNGIYPIATTEFSNNVINNWGQTKAGYGSGDVSTADLTDDQYSKNNFIGNYYINNKNPHPTTNLYRGDANHQMHNTGNWYGEASTTGAITGANQITNVNSYFGGGTTFVSTAFAITGVSADTRDTAAVALQRVRDYSGMNWQNRHEIDQAIINKIGDSDFNSINDLSGSTQAAQWATLMTQQTAVTRAAGYDTDRDGMPDVWEIARGLNAAVANNNADFDTDGYTDLEEYINEVGAWPANKTLVFTNANANTRYAEINNWGNIWQPSRYDSAQINTGTLTIDAVGQEARHLSIAPTTGNSATLQVTSGAIDIRETLTVGTSGTGTATQTGGLVRAGTSVTIGGTAAPGTYNLTGGTLATALLKKGNASSAFNLTGGVLHADTIDFSLTNNGGTIAPGSDTALQAMAAASMKDINGNTESIQSFIGTTQVNGNLSLQSGLVQIDLASPTSFDKIIVSNSLSFGGSLGIVLNNGYVPVPGDAWRIFTASGFTGSFDSVTSGFGLQQNGGEMFLVVLPEPASISFLALAGILLGRRRKK